MEATPRGARIELNNFSWHHPGRPEPVISGLNFTINPGEKVLLLGTSGEANRRSCTPSPVCSMMTTANPPAAPSPSTGKHPPKHAAPQA